jgi:hypothetical protein
MPFNISTLGLIGGFAVIASTLSLKLLPVNKPASAAISFSLTNVKGAGTRLIFLGGEFVATDCVGEAARLEVEKSVTVAVSLLS